MYTVDSILELLLQGPLNMVHTIVWDLDGTLGNRPGWQGDEVCEYVDNCEELSEMLSMLRDKYGVQHAMVSRNGNFCDARYAASQERFRRLGFDVVLPCYRRRDHSKVREFEGELGQIVLIDDQEPECRAAALDGAFSLHIHGPIYSSLPQYAFTLMYPQ